MESGFRISNALANVFKFLAIEVLLALIIEPAIQVINQMRAQRLAISGKPVQIRTSLFRRDFSGPAVGVKGWLWKVIIFVATLAALLATEFAFDYSTKSVPSKNTVMLTGLLNTSVEPRGIWEYGEPLFDLVRCSYTSESIVYERRVTPDGECYQKDGLGFRFKEPCALNPTMAHEFGCYTDGDKIVKLPGPSHRYNLSEMEFLKNATFVFPGAYEENDALYIGKRDRNGQPVRYCASNSGQTNNGRSTACPKNICLSFPKESDTVVICAFVSTQLEGRNARQSVFRNVSAYPYFFEGPVVRIGSHTFHHAGCADCMKRISFMVGLVASSLCMKQDHSTITSSAKDVGIAVAMLALGVPGEVGRHVDHRLDEQVGMLIVKWSLLIPLAVIIVFSLVVGIWALFAKSVVKIPLEYASAMFYARQRQLNGKSPKQVRWKNRYNLGLVSTCEKNTLYLSMHADNTVKYSGQRIGETNERCEKNDCERCGPGAVVCDSDVRGSEVEEKSGGLATVGTNGTANTEGAQNLRRIRSRGRDEARGG